MTDFGYFASLVPAGYFMCMYCFESFPVCEAWEDRTGQKWDVCAECVRLEEGVKRQRDARGEG